MKRSHNCCAWQTYGEQALQMGEQGGKEDEESPDGVKMGAVPPHGDPKDTMKVQASSV